MRVGGEGGGRMGNRDGGFVRHVAGGELRMARRQLWLGMVAGCANVLERELSRGFTLRLEFEMAPEHTEAKWSSLKDSI